MTPETVIFGVCAVIWVALVFFFGDWRGNLRKKIKNPHAVCGSERRVGKASAPCGRTCSRGIAPAF